MLSQCTGRYGDFDLIDGRPSIMSFRNALYVPVGDQRSAAGLYDSGRRIIPAAAYHRGPGREVLGSYVTPYIYSDFCSDAGKETFIYCGHLHAHFGHFLLSSFSRYWPFIEPDFLRTVRIVVHVTGGVAEYLSERPFAVDIFAAIGLTQDNFVSFNKPTRLENAWVVAPSFEETSFAHKTFAHLGNYAGARLSKDVVPNPNNRPVWLSKEKLTSGVKRVVNEASLTEILSRRGIDIAYPETLSLAEQAVLWRDRTVVGGFVGSAFHAGVLAPGRAIVGVSDSTVVMSSFPLIDSVNNAKAIYLGVTADDMEEIAGDNQFDSLRKIYNLDSFADSICAAFAELEAKT